MANQDKGGYHKEHQLKTSELPAVRENADEKVKMVIKYPFWHSNENGQKHNKAYLSFSQFILPFTTELIVDAV